MTIGTLLISYLAGALAFALLSAFLATRLRKQAIDRPFFVACVISTLWCTVFALSNVQWPVKLAFEIARDASWVYFLLRLNKQDSTSSTSSPRIFSFRSAALFFLYSSLAALVIYGCLFPQFASQGIGQYLITGGLICSALVGLELVETLFRHTAQEDRWGIKFACIGLGTLFAYDFYLFTDALLFRRVNVEIWVARGLVNALIVPLLLTSSIRNPRWTVRLVVSRRVLYQSATIVGASLYLMTMAAAGYYFRYVGGRWGTILQVALGFASAIILITVLFSGTFRSRLRVYLSKNFYQHDYDYREEWLRFTRTISQPGPDLEQRTIRAIAELVESPGGILYLKKDSENFISVASTNLPVPDGIEPAESPFIRLLRDKHWVVDLVEYRSKPERYPTVSAMPSGLADIPRAWLVVPLIVSGDLLGFVLLYASRSSVELNWEVLDILKIAGSQAAGGLAQKQVMNDLTVARQFESFNRMSTFVVHDLKNMVSQLSLLVANAKRHKDSVEFQEDMVATVRHSVDRMNLLLQKFTARSGVDRQRPISIEDIVTRAIESKSIGSRAPQLVGGTNGVLVLADSVRLERVLGHLIQNAMEASTLLGKVTVTLSATDKCAIVEVHDSGCGMTSEFVAERLFKPFESTKPAGMGIGVFESRAYVEELGGTIRVASELDVGTTFFVSLPVYHDRETKTLAS